MHMVRLAGQPGAKRGRRWGGSEPGGAGLSREGQPEIERKG